LATNGSPRTKRWRRWIGFSLLFLFLALGAAFAYRFFHGRDQRYLQRGQLYLDHGDANNALAQFRAALKVNPKLTEARVGIVRAHIRRNEFQDALDEVKKAAENGLAQSAASLLNARVTYARARNSIEKERLGKGLTIKTCEQVIAEDVDPAIALVQQNAEKVEKPAEAYTLLGDLFSQKVQIENDERSILTEAHKQAQEHDKKDEMVAREKDLRALVPKIRSVTALAHQAYEDAIKKDPTALEPRMALATEALQDGTGQAMAILEPLLSLPHPSRRAIYLMAKAEWYGGELDRAVKHMRLLNDVAEPRREYLVTEAAILIEAGRWPEARAVADQLLKTNTRRAEVRWVMGSVLLHEGHADEALDYLQNIFDPKALEQSRQNLAAVGLNLPKVRLLLAQALMSSKPPKREQANTEYTKILNNCDELLKYYNELRKYYSELTPAIARNVSKLNVIKYQACLALAGATRELGAAAALKNAKLAFGLAPERPEAFQIYHDLSKASGAAPEACEQIALDHANAMARDPAQLKAACEFLQKEYDEFKDAREKGAQVRLRRANFLEQMRLYPEAIAAYEELRKEFPTSWPVARDLAGLQVKLEHYKEVKEIYEPLLAARPNDTRVVTGLVDVLLRMNDVAGARAVLDRTTRAGEVWPRLLRSLMFEKRMDEAASLAKSYAESNPSNAPAQCMLAEVLWAQGDLKGAKAAFDATLKLAPDFGPAVRRALLDLEENRPADAVTLLRAAAEKLHTDFAKTDLAVALQADGKVQEAAAILKGIAASAQGPDARLDMPRWYLAVLLAGEGYLQNAGAMSDLLAWRDFLGLPADRLQLLQRIAAAAKPSILAAKVNLASWLNMNKCPGVLEQVELLQKELPGEPLTACWHARLLDGAGRSDEAAKEYRDILAAHPRLVVVRLFLAESQERNNKPEEAIKSLEESLNELPPEMVGEVQMLRARLLEVVGRLDEAIAGYQAITAPPALAAVACNDLAMLYLTKRNDPDSALPIAKQAVQLSPKDPRILDTLGWILYMKGENDGALENLRKAKAGLPGNPTVRYHLGKALLKIGRKDDAKAELQGALAISPDFPEAADARAQLAGI
jgi:cellulose synthase operon protein C